MISEATWELVAGKFVARELDTDRPTVLEHDPGHVPGQHKPGASAIR